MTNFKNQSGSILLETLIAILIFFMGVVGLMGLQAAAFTDVAQSKYRMDAGFLTNQIISSMWVDGVDQVPNYASLGGAKTATWLAQVNNTLPGASAIPPTIVVKDVSNATGKRYEVTVTVSWIPPKDTVPHRYIGSAYINRNG
jgi:type IV pilus assembly protein PilV